MVWFGRKSIAWMPFPTQQSNEIHFVAMQEKNSIHGSIAWSSASTIGNTKEIATKLFHNTYGWQCWCSLNWIKILLCEHISFDYVKSRFKISIPLCVDFFHVPPNISHFSFLMRQWDGASSWKHSSKIKNIRSPYVGNAMAVDDTSVVKATAANVTALFPWHGHTSLQEPDMVMFLFCRVRSLNTPLRPVYDSLTIMCGAYVRH